MGSDVVNFMASENSLTILFSHRISSEDRTLIRSLAKIILPDWSIKVNHKKRELTAHLREYASRTQEFRP